MSTYYLAIDQGTTGTTVLLVDTETLKIHSKINNEFPQIFPKPGWVEHDLNDIWNSFTVSLKQLFETSKVDPTQIISIGITNQRETTCAYTKDGTPLHNAIVWQDRRTSDYCNNKKESYSQHQKKTGLPLDPYFSATKMNWLLSNSEKISKQASENNLLLSTIDTFLLFKLSGEFKTDTSNASRTLLMNLKTCNWDNDLLSFFDIDHKFLPKIVESISDFGTTKSLSFLPDGIPINCILGDQQAALFGQAGQSSGSLKCTYGTGAFILLNTGNEIVHNSNGLLTTVAYSYNGKNYYALEGSAYIAGAAVQWLRDNLKVINSAPQVEEIANKVESMEEMEHIMFLPFFTGIGSPYWNPDAKAAIVGLTRDSGNPHIARACLEGIALSVNDSVNSLISDYKGEINEIRVDGGACLNNLLMQMQADFSKKTIVRPKIIETTAYGVTLGCAVALGNIDIDEIDKVWNEESRFAPKESDYHVQKSKLWTQTIKKMY